MLATIQGYDRPGVTASLMSILAEHGAYILDIGQSDIHSHLNLGILFQMNENDSGSVLKDLLFKGYELDVQIRFTPISTNEYGEWVNAQGKNRYIITVVARKMTAEMLSAVAGAAADQGLNIDNIRRLTGRYVGDVVDGRRKADLLRLIAQVERVDLMQTVAVGDGANDLPMLSLAGLGIAFHAKPKVKASAEQRISSVGLDGILYFLGYKDSLFDEQMIECMKDGTCSTLFPHH